MAAHKCATIMSSDPRTLCGELTTHLATVQFRGSVTGEFYVCPGHADGTLPALWGTVIAAEVVPVRIRRRPTALSPNLAYEWWDVVHGPDGRCLAPRLGSILVEDGVCTGRVTERDPFRKPNDSRRYSTVEVARTDTLLAAARAVLDRYPTIRDVVDSVPDGGALEVAE